MSQAHCVILENRKLEKGGKEDLLLLNYVFTKETKIYIHFDE